MKMRHMGLVLCAAVAAQAAVQEWDDTPDGLWDLDASNWDSNAVWANGNTAAFTGLGGVVKVSGAVEAAGLTFGADGYTVATNAVEGDMLTLAGAPVIHADEGVTGTLSAFIGGTEGFRKTGQGTLVIPSLTNAFTGPVFVDGGILRLAYAATNALGNADGTAYVTVADGATFDMAVAFRRNIDVDVTIKGAGMPEQNGALANNGPSGSGVYNAGIGNITLTGDATFGGTQRFDLWGGGSVAGNGFTLTKAGPNEIAFSRSVNNCRIVIANGIWTVQGDTTLGGSDFPTELRGGTLRCWGARTITEIIEAYSGGIEINSSASVRDTAEFKGAVNLCDKPITLTVAGSNTNRLLFTGGVTGAGGLATTGGGIVVLGGSNAYTGPTTVGGSMLYVGLTNGFAGTLATGAVTNNNRLFADGPESSVTVTGGLWGGGATVVRYGATMTLDGGVSSNSTVHVADGTFSLTNGARAYVYSNMSIASRSVNDTYFMKSDYQFLWPSPWGVTAVVNVPDGCELLTRGITFGNQAGDTGCMLTGIVNQAGGVVCTTGDMGEGNGLRMGHYPDARSFYNLSGGTLTIENDWDLGIATDGQGWFTMTGGEVFAKRVMLNERDGTGGFGTLCVAGGVLNVGSLTGSDSLATNGIAADSAVTSYKVELGGGEGGVIRAVTNIGIAVNATLMDTGTRAVTFDTADWNILISGNLTGTGGLSKVGSGTLTLSGVNTYEGATRVMAGRLVRTAFNALPYGNEVQFGVSSDGSDTGGCIHSDGDLTLEGLTIGIANSEDMDTLKTYTVATWGGTLLAPFSGKALPAPWFVQYDMPNKRAFLSARVGTVMRLK